MSSFTIRAPANNIHIDQYIYIMNKTCISRSTKYGSRKNTEIGNS